MRGADRSGRRFVARATMAFAIVAPLAAGAQSSGGVVVPSHLLPAADHAALVAAVAEARSRSAAAFAALAQIRARLPDLDAARRGSVPVVTPLLKSLGPEGLMPMLAELALDARPRAGLGDAAWDAWRSGLLEAVGALRDPRAEPVLNGALDAPGAGFLAVRAAAEALGKLGSDAAVARLSTRVAEPGPRGTAVLAGMGGCRRTGCVAAVASVLSGSLDDEAALFAVRALGHAGSEWAWRTPALASQGRAQAADVRAAAASALVSAFARHSGEVRAAASNSLMVVADPSTRALIARAASQISDPALRSALDALGARFDRLVR